MTPEDGGVGRAAGLLEQHPWMDHPTALTIAQNTGSDQQAQQQAQTVQTTLQNSWDGYQQAFFDPVLQAQPSTALATAQYIHSTLGPPPVTAGTNLAVQQALVREGLLPASAANGEWTPESEQAYNQAISAYKQDQLAGGHKPLTSKVSAFLGGLLHDATHPWDAVVGWGDSARDAVGYFGGWLGTGFGTLGTAHTQDQFAANIVNTLGGHTDAQAQAKVYANPLNAVGNALSLGGAASVVKGVGKAAVEQAGKRAAQQAAEQALAHGGETAASGQAQAQLEADIERATKIGQVLSASQRMGFTQRAINDIGDAYRDGVLPKDAPQVQRQLGLISKTFLRGPLKLTGPADQLPNLLSKSWMDNLPGLSRMAPAAEWLASKEGAVLKFRNLMAQPYRNPLIRAGGIAAQRAEIGSLGIHAAANALPGTELQHDVNSEHSVLDSWITNLDHWEQRTFGMSVDPTDLLLGPLHGDLAGAGRASQVIGSAVNHYTSKLADGLGKLGIPAAFQVATGLDRHGLLAQFGGDEAAMHTWMLSHANKYAADTWAERQMQKGVTLPDTAEEDRVGALKDQWFSLPDEQRVAHMQTMAQVDPHMEWLRNRISNDILRNATSKAARQQAVAKDAQTWTEGLKLMQGLHRDGALNYVMGPKGHALLKDDLTARAIQGGTADIPGGPGSAQHLAQLNPEKPGAIGMASATTKTADEAQDDLRGYQKRATDIGQMEDRVAGGKLNTQLAAELRTYLHTHFNMDASALGVYGNNVDSLMAQIDKRSHALASNVLPTWDQPEWVTQRIQELKDKGYKLVVGSHIGHAYDGTLPDLGPMWQWKSRLRQYIGKAGLDPERVPDLEVAKATHGNIAGKIHAFLTGDPQARLMTQRADYRTVLAVIEHAVAPQLPPLIRGTFHALANVGGNKTEIAHLAATEFAGEKNALTLARQEMERRLAAQIGLRDLPDKVTREALMKTQDIDTGHGTFHWGGVDQYTADGIINAIRDGYRLPGYMMGWQAIENWARAGFGFAHGGLVFRNAQPLYNAVKLWPNKYVQVRNALRFTASPLFDARRSVKQNYKMGLEGVQPVWNPLQKMIERDELPAATALWSRISGAKPDTQMDADRYLLNRSIFGMYSPQWHGAYFVNELRKQGKSADEIKQAYDRVFKYGSQGGRTSVERSINTIFFPFSFEKNLLRNTGAYIVDKPGTALALDLAVEEWRKLDANGQWGQFVQAHLPVLQEMQKLNAFSHGISPGQLGGINAASIAGLNLLLPQHWGQNLTSKNLAKYLPVWKDAGQLYTAIRQQADIADNALYDTYAKVGNKQWTPRPTLTPNAQIGEALRTKAAWQTQLAPILDYNAHQSSDADKYLWPADPKWGDLQGKPIDKTTIGQYMNVLYPAYNPNKAASVAQASAAAADAFIAQVAKTDPAKAQQLAAFKKSADKLIGYINRDSYDPATAAQVQGAFQQYAEKAAMSDPVWLTFYKKFYAWGIGQIVSPTGKANSA